LIDKALYELLEPGVRAMGYELVTVEMTGRGRSSLLRVYIDSPQGITVDDCARVSGQVSAILDVEDPIPDHYTLEVSSPGMDRPLCKLDHFRAVIGQRIKIRTSSPVCNRRGFTGTLAGVAQEGVSLDVDGERYDIPMSVIVRARLVPDFGAAGSGLNN
jgi:ribosome maturation factor RimP